MRVQNDMAGMGETGAAALQELLTYLDETLASRQNLQEADVVWSDPTELGRLPPGEA